MKPKSILSTGLAVTMLAAGGCASNNVASSPDISGYAAAASLEHGVALSEFGPARQAPQSPSNFQLGAGDALGQAIFTNYAAIVRANANWQVAGAEEID